MGNEERMDSYIISKALIIPYLGDALERQYFKSHLTLCALPHYSVLCVSRITLVVAGSE